MESKEGNFLSFMQDVAMQPFEDITYKSMHGGLLVLKKRREFGIIKGSTLYLYADKKTRDYYQHANSLRYTFAKKSGESVVTDYWAVPTHIVSNTKDFGQWISDAIQAVGRKISKLDKKNEPK